MDDIQKDPNKFSMMIERDAVNKKTTCMETLIKYCEENYIDAEEIAHLVNRALKGKIESEMRELNYLPKKATLDL